MKILSLSLLCLALADVVRGADLVLWREGRTDYQIVVPDRAASPSLEAGLRQTARLLQTAFKANGVEVPVVPEAQRDASRPGVFVGQTAYAGRNGVDGSKLEGWGYVQQAVDGNIIIAGHDEPSKIDPAALGRRDPGWDFAGTVKGAVDFARAFLGVRFLYPECPSYSQVGDVAKIDLLNSPAMEFLPTPVAAVPQGLKVTHVPLLRINTAHPASGGFFDLSLNRFPRVDAMFGGHTWGRAVPPADYAKSHPEYFALVNGVRQATTEAGAQYCLSNPDVQELIYKDLVRQLERGYASVDLGQPDGFQACQCEACAALYGTGDDWAEKIWIFNRDTAGRLLKSHPQGRVTMMSYILTARPPRTFKSFPANTNIMLTGTNEEDIAPWRGYDVPGGFSGYVYNWCPNLVSRYTPMRTPGFVEAQMKRLAACRVQSLLRDGPGQLYGLEGPVYYTMGRMFDDPEGNTAAQLVPEFCEAAFGKAAPAMLAFYDRLYHAINLYSDHLGTRGDAWSFQTYDGRRRKTVTDPFQLLAFLYPPQVLSALEADLGRAEAQAGSTKCKTRLALVRREFDYVRHLARVVHLHQAYVLVPDEGSRDRLLDAIDARNTFIEALFKEGRRTPAPTDWALPMFPFSGHSASHLKLAHDGYQEPFANTCLNWDTKAVRQSPTPGLKRLVVTPATGTVTMDDAGWQEAPATELMMVPPLNRLPRKSLVQLRYDRDRLYFRAVCELEPDAKAAVPGSRREQPLGDRESLDLYVAPRAEGELAYRFMIGVHPTARYDARNGAITDVMDPRHGRDDATWKGQWKAESRVDAKKNEWCVLMSLPFTTLEVPAPAPGTVWKANFARNHPAGRDQMDRFIWSSAVGNTDINDRTLFGEIEFR